jgi:hypothetical protein
MGELGLQLSLFEPTVKTIEVTEIDGMVTGGLLQYFDLKKWKDLVIPTCAGDITVIINALEDYARILEQTVGEWNLEGYHKAMYELHAARCRKISDKYQKATGYNYEAALAKCRKRKEKNRDDDIGEDGLTLTAKYGKRVSQNKDNIVAADMPTSGENKAQIELFE